MSEITRNQAIQIVEDIRTAISAGSVTNTMEAQVLEYCVSVLGRRIVEASLSGHIENLPDVAAFLAGISPSATLKALLEGITDAVEVINANIGNGYVYAGIATPSGTPVSGKVFYLAKQAGQYANFGGLTVTEGVNILKRNGSTWTQEQLLSMADIRKNPLIGYYECDTAGDTSAKTVTAAGYVLPATGGSVKIKMANRNTVANATLNINSTGAKPLYYNGQRAGVGNTWDTNEIIEVFYDGAKYQAYNVAGCNGDGVFDISAYNLTAGQPTPYEDLAAALGPKGDNVPLSLRKGGMSIKFVQRSADNKYVQYRLMSDTFNTTIANWQGVDDEPTSGSDNLVKSEGIYLKINQEKNRAEGAEITLQQKIESEVDKRKQEIQDVRDDVFSLIHDYEPIVIEGSVVNAPDEEDITQQPNNLLKFKDKDYNPIIFSGLGRKYLRKNIIINEDYTSFDGFVMNPEADAMLGGQPDSIFWDRLCERFIAEKDGVYYLDWQDSGDYIPVSADKIYVNENIPYFWNGEDLAVDDDVIARYGNILTQEMMSDANTIYVIQYDFELDGAEITIPENCVLEFEGGSLRNGTLTGTDTQIRADKVAIFTGITIGGTWNVQRITSDWFGDAKTVDNTLQQIENLLSDSIYNEVTIEAGDYWFVQTDGRSNVFNIGKPYTKLVLIGNLRLRGTNYDDKRFLSINDTHDVEICGGGFIYGDKLTHIYADGNTYPDGIIGYYQSGMSTYETCHTLSVYSSYNINIEGINIRNSVGDGIDIKHSTAAANRFVNVRNVTIENTRRQGITANTNCGVFENIRIEKVHGTSPEAGIDVEISTQTDTHASSKMIFKNIYIEDCTVGFVVYTSGKTIDNIRNIIFEHIETKNVALGFHVYRKVNSVVLKNCIFDVDLARYPGAVGGARSSYGKYKNILAGDDCIIEGCIFNFSNDIPSEESIEGEEVYALTLADYGWTGELVKIQNIIYTTFTCPKINAIGYLSNMNMLGCHIDALVFDTCFNRDFDSNYMSNISNCHINVSDSFILKNLVVNNSQIHVGGTIECEKGCSLIGNIVTCGSYIKCLAASFVSNNTITTEANPNPNEDASWNISKFLFWLTESATITSNYISSNSKLDAICVIDVSATFNRPDVLIPKFTNNYILRKSRFDQLLYIVDDDCIVMENNYASDKKLQDYINKDYNLSGADLPVNACKGSTFIKDGNNRLLCNVRKIKEKVLTESVSSGSTSFIQNTLTDGKLYYANVSSKSNMYFSKVNSNPGDDDLAVILPSVSSGESSKYFTALSRTVYPYIYMENNHSSYSRIFSIYDVEPWREFDDAAVGVNRNGITSDRPVGSDIYVGFMYFDTSVGINKPIYASAISGDTVTWVDATGTPV